MVPIRTPQVKYDVFKLQGGLDEVTPTLSLPPGVAREALNFESSITGGYTRIAGYERFDGRPSPSDAEWTFIALSSVAGVSVGSTIKNLANTVNGVVVALDGNTVIYTKAVGTFTVAENVYVGAALIGQVTNNTTFFVEPLASATYTAAAADVYRADIGAVPGSGSIRGVACLNGVTYAWRNNVGGTAMAIYKSSATGWQLVNLGWELGFNTGTGTAIAVGNTVSNAAGTATGVVAAVVVENGTAWAGATGRLILSSVTGTWATSDQIRVAGHHCATATGAQTAITLQPNGRADVVYANMGGAAGATKIYGADGVNRGFEFDGTTYVPIRTGMAQDTPTRAIVFRNYLFFSFGASLQYSSVAGPYVWNPILGAGEMVFPQPITSLQVLPGDESGGALAIYTRNNTFILYGTAPANWAQVTFDRGTGAIPYTTQNMVEAYALDDKGVMSLSTTRRFGNFDSATLTFPIRPFIQARRNLAVASGLNREKSQYRVFYSDGYALYITIANERLLGSMPVLFPNPVTCWCEGEATDGSEFSFFGSTNGYVYRMDTGPDFDGQAIPAFIKLNFNPEGASRLLKRYRRASLEVTGTGYATFDFGFSLGYDTTDIDQAGSTTYAAPFANGRWDAFVWDTFYWDSRGLAPVEVQCDGTAENIALALASSTRYSQPFTINSATLHYSVRRGIR